jgi:tRNA-modifying protein YgfZ
MRIRISASAQPGLIAMTSNMMAVLGDRGVVRVAGPDAEKLLQDVITNDLGQLAATPALHAALLTPQGKILFDFFVVKAADGFRLEVAADKTADLVKRLIMYRLRAKVEIADASPGYRVLAVWGASPHSFGETTGMLSFFDPRLAALGLRILADATFAADIASATNGMEVPAAEYHAHRIGLGVPEGGKDYAFGDTFPHEADLDQLNGVSFTKGCFVGQEVVSRMQHRGSARKRVVPVTGEAALTPGTEVKAGAASIGMIGSVAGARALGLIRLDRAAEATTKGVPLTAANVRLTLVKPAWATFDLAPAATAEAP